MRRKAPCILKLLVGAVGLVSVTLFLARTVENAADLELQMPPMTLRQDVDPTTFQDAFAALVDWHDYGLIEAERKSVGPGEQGAGVELPTDAETEQRKEKLYKVNGFNAAASELIALNRSLPDIRHPKCQDIRYAAHLPTASVVIPFHNEHLSVLLRTVTSVFRRSPRSLIKEIILVDDYSSKEELGQNLESYLSSHFGSVVRVLRATRREGLIRARLLGARAAVSDVLIFLDSHTEVNVNWLPPLLDPIAKDRRTVVCPFIDVINHETFAYRAQDEGARGAFDWEFYYKRLPLLSEDLKSPTEPFKSPVMAGGLFAIDRNYFWELGGYDEGLDVWGGEQYELSFKIWQCGGQMFDAPCSRVGHIYRKFAPFPNPRVGDFVGRNYRRVAEVWMDEYKEFLYKRRPHYRNLDYGDVSKQKALRKKLNCKSFKWFMETVAFDQPLKYPPVEPPDFASGSIRNVGADKCLDTKFKGQGKRFSLNTCTSSNGDVRSEQNFVLTWHKDLRPAKRNVCFDVSSGEKKAPVLLWTCHGMHGNQLFKYEMNTKQLIHPITAQCLDCDRETLEVFMNPCDVDLNTQKWLFDHINKTAILNDWNS